MSSDHENERFIASTFGSVWALELLLLLRQAPERAHSHEALIGQLRASDAVVSKSIQGLSAAGLVLEEGDGTVRYAPVSPELDAQVSEAEALYRARPDAVRRIIVAGYMSGVQAFADAFRFKGD